jgi:hypothetical protein
MTYLEALEIIIAEDRSRLHFRKLCAESNPNIEQRDGYRQLAIELAGGGATDPPSRMRQIASAAGAAGRAIVAAATGQPVLVSDEIRAARQAICDECEHWDVENRRCRKCGCYGLKLDLATERCPIGKWERVTGPVEPE